MTNSQRAVSKYESSRGVKAHRPKPFKVRPRYRRLKRVKATTLPVASKSLYSSDVEMSEAEPFLRSSVRHDEHRDLLDETAESPDSVTNSSASDADDELSHDSAKDNEDNDMFDDNQESSYDANETLQIFNAKKEVDFLSYKFGNCVVSARQEEIRKEAFKMHERRVHGWADDTVQLSLRLEARGLYPLMPITWRSDFPFLSQQLFADDPDEAYFFPFTTSSKLKRLPRVWRDR